MKPRQIYKRNNRQDKYRVFLLLPHQAQHFCHTESLHLPGDPMTAALFRTVIKDIPYYIIRNSFVFTINHVLFEHLEGTFTL